MIPITLGIYKYIGNNTTQWNSIMAAAVVASVPAAVLLVVAQRYVAAGVTAGAIKGLSRTSDRPPRSHRRRCRASAPPPAAPWTGP